MGWGAVLGPRTAALVSHSVSVALKHEWHRPCLEGLVKHKLPGPPPQSLTQ